MNKLYSYQDWFYNIIINLIQKYQNESKDGFSTRNSIKCEKEEASAKPGLLKFNANQGQLQISAAFQNELHQRSSDPSFKEPTTPISSRPEPAKPDYRRSTAGLIKPCRESGDDISLVKPECPAKKSIKSKNHKESQGHQAELSQQ